MNYLVGTDWYAPKDWVVMAQSSPESILKYEDQIAQPHHNSLPTLNVLKKLLDNTLQFSNFTYSDLNHKGRFSQFTAAYSLNDFIQFSLGYDWFGGDEGVLSAHKNNSEVWAKAKYSL